MLSPFLSLSRVTRAASLCDRTTEFFSLVPMTRAGTSRPELGTRPPPGGGVENNVSQRIMQP